MLKRLRQSIKTKSQDLLVRLSIKLKKLKVKVRHTRKFPQTVVSAKVLEQRQHIDYGPWLRLPETDVPVVFPTQQPKNPGLPLPGGYRITDEVPTLNAADMKPDVPILYPRDSFDSDASHFGAGVSSVCLRPDTPSSDSSDSSEGLPFWLDTGYSSPLSHDPSDTSSDTQYVHHELETDDMSDCTSEGTQWEEDSISSIDNDRDDVSVSSHMSNASNGTHWDDNYNTQQTPDTPAQVRTTSRQGPMASLFSLLWRADAEPKADVSILYPTAPARQDLENTEGANTVTAAVPRVAPFSRLLGPPKRYY